MANSKGIADLMVNDFGVSKAQMRTGMRFAISDLLTSPSRFRFVILEAVINLLMFYAFARQSRWEDITRPNPALWTAAAIYAISFIVFGLGLGLYEPERRFKPSLFAINGFVAAFLAASSTIVAMYFTFYFVLGRLMIMYGALGSWGGVFIVRILLSRLLAKYPFRFSIIGTSPCAEELKTDLSSPFRSVRGYHCVAIPDSHLSGDYSAAFREIVDKRIGNVVLARSAFETPELLEFALKTIQFGCRVIDDITFFGMVFEKLPIDQQSKYWVLRESIETRRLMTDFVKRSIDIVLSLVSLVILSPLLLFIAIAVKLSSPGPVLYVQQRFGALCMPFKLYKFRTMRMGSSAAGGFTAKSDPRVTWIGKILRPTHFDELPQLWNILIGHMSFVGPRPEEVNFANRMRKEVPLYELRYIRRPGLTGHAQITQGYAMDSVEDTKEKLAYDLFYICRYSIWMDLRILVRTSFCLLRGSR